MGIIALLLILAGVGVIIYTLYWFVTRLYKIVFPPKIENPYIKAHKIKNAHEKAYDEYIEWLDKNNPDIPFEKMKFPEEEMFEREVNKSKSKP